MTLSTQKGLLAGRADLRGSAHNWWVSDRGASQTISEATRRDIMDLLSADGVSWSGRLEESDFLGRIWDLSKIRSTDNRFPDVAGDIWQHRVNNYDWEADWVFHDDRFNLLRCPDETFARFLAEMCHPVVRPEAEAAQALAAGLNESLANDGWELVEAARLSGRPVFEARSRTAYRQVPEAFEVSKYERLKDPQVLREHLKRIDRDISTDPPGAIGSSKELVESVCKTILRDYDIEYRESADLMELYKQVQAALNLNVAAVDDSKKGSEAAVKSLRALVTTIKSLAELRNAVGGGHGRATTSPALTRHARLSFNATVAVCEFLMDTWHHRRASP